METVCCSSYYMNDYTTLIQYFLCLNIAELNQLEDLNTTRITRILTTDFPQYFAIVSRVRQEVHAIGPEGENNFAIKEHFLAIFLLHKIYRRWRGEQHCGPAGAGGLPSGRPHQEDQSRTSGKIIEFIRQLLRYCIESKCQVNMFRPRKGVQSSGQPSQLKKITVNHVPKKKKFSLVW